MVAVILVAVSIALSIVLGRLSRMTLKEVVTQALVMSAAALTFYGLVELL